MVAEACQNSLGSWVKEMGSWAARRESMAGAGTCSTLRTGPARQHASQSRGRAARHERPRWRSARRATALLLAGLCGSASCLAPSALPAALARRRPRARGCVCVRRGVVPGLEASSSFSDCQDPVGSAAAGAPSADVYRRWSAHEWSVALAPEQGPEQRRRWLEMRDSGVRRVFDLAGGDCAWAAGLHKFAAANEWELEVLCADVLPKQDSAHPGITFAAVTNDCACAHTHCHQEPVPLARFAEQEEGRFDVVRMSKGACACKRRQSLVGSLVVLGVGGPLAAHAALHLSPFACLSAVTPLAVVLSYAVACVSEPMTCGGVRLGATGTAALVR